jgi:glycine cleavage system H protein
VKELQEFQNGLQWKIQEGNQLTLGITQSALDLAGALIEVDLGDEQDEFEAGDWIGELRGKNSTVEMVTPENIRVMEINREVIEQLSQLEDDPTGDAWLIRAEVLDG